MLRYALIFLVIALLASAFGMFGLSAWRWKLPGFSSSCSWSCSWSRSSADDAARTFSGPTNVRRQCRLPASSGLDGGGVLLQTPAYRTPCAADRQFDSLSG